MTKKIKISQISDIHWRGSTRLEEYTKSFEKLFELLKEEQPDIILCTGDIFHTKTQNITPEIVDKMVWMFQELMKIAPVRTILGNHDCFTPDHQVLTQGGWKSFTELMKTKNDKVATFNSLNEEIEFQLPIEWIQKPFQGELIHLTGKEIDSLVTPTHEFLYTYHNIKNYLKKTASDLPKNVCIPINGKVSNFQEDSFAALLGFALADGSFVLKNKKTGACRVQFHFKKERKIKYLSSLLRKLNYKTNVRPQKDGAVFICVYENLAKEIYKFFDGKKIIPVEILSKSNSFIRSFLNGYLSGDGSNSKSNFYSFASISEENRDMLVTLARLVGGKSHSSSLFVKGNYLNSKQQFTGNINLNNKVNCTLVRKTEKVKYDGDVFCVTVPNGNILVRRNDKIYVAGNCNLSNESRQDVISPIVRAINSDPQLLLYKKSGNYTDPHFDNINWCVFSCTDKEGWSRVSPVEDKVNIALFHGSISGCQTDGGYRMTTGEESISFFNEYDFVLMGDIHKMQFMAERKDANGLDKPWIGYPGSMIQQNFGEDTSKGYLTWEIQDKDNWDISFTEIENYQPFLTIPWTVDLHQTIAKTREVVKDNFLPGTRFRFSSQTNISEVEQKQLQDFLKLEKKAEEVVFKIDVVTNLDNIQTNFIKTQKTSLRNNKEVLLSLYEEYLKNNKTAHPLSSKQIEQAKKVVEEYLAKFNSSEIDDVVRDVSWSIKSMKFDNTFRYGEGNSIDFSDLNGIIGIFAPNRTGKSSIVGTMMYSLFNATDRGPVKTAHVINKNQTSCKVTTHLDINGVDYVIERKSQKDEPKKKRKKETDDEKTSTSLTITKVLPDGSTLPITGISRDDSDKELRKLIGTADDFLLTSFASQGDMDRFIREGATERKSILSRFLDLDIFKKLAEYSKTDCSELNIKTKRYSNIQWEQVIEACTKDIQELTAGKIVYDSRVIEKKKISEDLRDWIFAKEKQFDISTINDLEKQILAKEKFIETLQSQESSAGELIKLKQAELFQVNLGLQAINIEDLELNNEKLLELKGVLSELESSFKVQTNTLEHQEKSVKKLNVVPCGDQFPQCHYIKDSHENKELLVEQKKLVEKLSKEYASTKEIFTEILNKKIAEGIRDYRTLTEKKTKLELSLSELRSKVSNSKMSQSLSEKEELKSKLEKLKLALEDSIEETIEEKRKEFKLAQEEIEACENLRANMLVQIGANNQKLEQHLKEKEECNLILNDLQIYESVYKAFSKNGIPAMILMSQLPAINQELHKILSSVVDFSIVLETDTSSNVMDVFIEDKTSRRVIETASGMEKMIASLALRVVLTTLTNLPKSNMFILDESFGPLDDVSIHQCLQLMTLLKNYYKTILVITHIAPIKEIVDKMIDIKVDEQYSYINV